MTDKINVAKTQQTQAVEKVINEIYPRAVFGDYNRHRPFLVVTPIGTVDPVRRAAGVTRHKGWAQVAHNWDVDERAEIVLRVSNRHMSEASVIIDIVNSKAVKNRYNVTDRDGKVAGDDDTVMAHYMGRYAEDITRALKNWADALKETAGIEIDTSAADEPTEEGSGE
jgi:hypothetical protein